MYYFYVLISKLDSSYYYGSTINLRRRYQEHAGGKVNSTKNRLPLELIYYEAYNLQELARSREQQVKRSGSVRAALHKRITRTEKGHARPPKGSRAISSAG